jgi:hypothetical protein
LELPSFQIWYYLSYCNLPIASFSSTSELVSRFQIFKLRLEIYGDLSRLKQ